MTKVRPAATASTVDLYWDSVQTPEKTSTQDQGRTSVSKPSPEEQRKEWIVNMRKPLTSPKCLTKDSSPHEDIVQGVTKVTSNIKDVTIQDHGMTNPVQEEVKKGKGK